MENCGIVVFIIICRGGDLINIVFVDFRIEDGIVNVGFDYEFIEGIVVFKFGEI